MAIRQTSSCVVANLLSVYLSLSGQLVSGQSVGFNSGTPLPLPKDPAQDCYHSAFHAFSIHNPTCLKAFWSYKDPDVECCEGLADYFGADSFKPSRNCFCVPEVWDWMELMHEENYIEWSSYAMVCSNMGYIVPYYSASGGTYCNGTAPPVDQLAAASVEGKPHAYPSRTLQKWLDALPSDGLVATSLATAIMSAIGLSAMVLPILYQLVLAAKETLSAPNKA